MMLVSLIFYLFFFFFFFFFVSSFRFYALVLGNIRYCTSVIISRTRPGLRRRKMQQNALLVSRETRTVRNGLNRMICGVSSAIACGFKKKNTHCHTQYHVHLLTLKVWFWGGCGNNKQPPRGNGFFICTHP